MVLRNKRRCCLPNPIRLITLQKRVVRIMSRSAFDTHTDPLFKNLVILNLESIYKLQIGKFMYQYKYG